MDAFGDVQAAREALHELRFARAQIPGQSNDRPSLCGPSPDFADGFCFRRLMRDDFHESITFRREE